MKSISAILFLAGLIACPGYFFYCTSFSGRTMDRIPVFSQDVSSLKLGGVTVQSSGGNAQWNTPVSIDLAPEMNPISVQAVVHYMKPAGAAKKRAGYRVELARGDKTVWVKTFTISARKEKNDEKSIKLGGLPKTTAHVNTFSVEESGQYTLDLRETPDHDLAVAEIDVTVRRNVLVPNKVVLISGGTALLLGIVGLIVFGKKRSSSPA